MSSAAILLREIQSPRPAWYLDIPHYSNGYFVGDLQSHPSWTLFQYVRSAAFNAVLMKACVLCLETTEPERSN